MSNHPFFNNGEESAATERRRKIEARIQKEILILFSAFGRPRAATSWKSRLSCLFERKIVLINLIHFHRKQICKIRYCFSEAAIDHYHLININGGF